MGQKVSPHGLRVGVIKDWDSKWYAGKANFADFLADELWTVDEVTGNGSGTYTFSSAKAAECLQGDPAAFAYLDEIDQEWSFSLSFQDLLDEPERCDVYIRCYLLSQAIAEAEEELDEIFTKAEEEE